MRKAKPKEFTGKNVQDHFGTASINNIEDIHGIHLQNNKLVLTLMDGCLKVPNDAQQLTMCGGLYGLPFRKILMGDIYK